MERHPGDPLFKTGELQTKKLIESDDPNEKMILTLRYLIAFKWGRLGQQFY